MKLDLTRWPLLLGAALCIGIGAWLLTDTGVVADRQFAAFAMFLIGTFLVGAFVHSGGREG